MAEVQRRARGGDQMERECAVAGCNMSSQGSEAQKSAAERIEALASAQVVEVCV